MTDERKKRIIILGGGFGGIYTAMYLERSLARDADVEVILINHDNFFLFTPMLHEVASCDLSITHIVTPIRKMLRNVQLFNGTVTAVDLHARRITVCHGSDDHSHDLEYDHLVLGLGSVTNFFGIPGLEERALTMKSLGDAIFLRNHVIDNLEEADTECAAGGRNSLLTFVVAGAGFAGAETMAAINDFAREALKFYPNLREKDLRMVLVHPGDLVLPELGPELGAYAQKKLAERGVDIRLKTKVTSFADGCVTLSSGESLSSCTLVWTAGTSPHPLLMGLPCQKDRGRVVVNANLEVTEWPGVWALGDCSSLIEPETSKPYPPTAQHAIRQGKILAKNLTASIRGGEKRPFKFKTIGLLASIGRRSGVAQIMGHNFSGFVAWFLWRTIYLSKLPRVEQQIRVALDWTLDLIFSRDIVQFLTRQSRGISHAEEHARTPEPVTDGPRS